MTDSKIYTILQISDSAFPTGGFSHSMGAEAAILHHQINNKDHLKIFILSSIENTGSSCLPFVKAAHEGFRDIERLEYLDSLLNASLLNHVSHRASRHQGKSFLTTICEVFPCHEISKLNECVENEIMHGHLAIIFAVVCATLNIPVLKVAQMFLYNSLRTVIASMVRLGKIGAVKAQRYQFEIQEHLDEIIKRNWMIPPEDSYITFPLPETLQNIHDALFSKLFYS